MPEPVTGRRVVSYPGRGAILVVPAEVWCRSLDAIRAYGAQRSEGLVFWGGVVSGDVMQVTCLYLPSHRPQGGCVRLTGEETRWVLRRLRERDEKLLAQVHSHPTEAFHSRGDDRGAASFHVGYFSVVVPRFGAKVTGIEECKVLEFDGGGFSSLAPEESGRRVRVLGLIEERLPRPAHLGKEKAWLSSIASSLRRRLTAPRRH